MRVNDEDIFGEPIKLFWERHGDKPSWKPFW